MSDPEFKRLLECAVEAYRTDADTLDVNGWRLRRASKGMNSIVYRTQSGSDDLALKISKRDERDRAGREYAATQALREAGLHICPRPFHLEREPEGLPGDVVISEWLPGRALEEPPAPEDRIVWQAILKSLDQAHRLTPENCSLSLQNAVMNIREPEDLLGYIQGWLARLPEGEIGALRHEQFKRLVTHVMQVTPPRWDKPAPITLIQCDSKPNNMLYHKGKIWLVDWENAGWSDPACDIADFFAKPNHIALLTDDQRAWIRAEYGRLRHDPTLAERAEVYERLFIVWWVLRASGYLLESSGDRLAGVQPIQPEKVMEQQTMLWQQACKIFGLNSAL